MKFGSIKGYYFLDAWVMANIIQLANYRFCQRFLDKKRDPCARMFDQMTMAARSCPANIAEGYSRHQTSRETEMKLLDVARATLSEVLSDYFFWSLVENIDLWPKNSDKYRWVADIKLAQAKYTDDWTREAQVHIRNEYQRFAPALEHESLEVVINAMIILCNRTIAMIERLMASRLDDFKETGGFTENLTNERLNARAEQSLADGAPTCPKCGKPMLKRTAKKGVNSGRQFWSCSGYPECTGTRPIKI